MSTPRGLRLRRACTLGATPGAQSHRSARGHAAGGKETAALGMERGKVKKKEKEKETEKEKIREKGKEEKVKRKEVEQKIKEKEKEKQEKQERRKRKEKEEKRTKQGKETKKEKEQFKGQEEEGENQDSTLTRTPLEPLVRDPVSRTPCPKAIVGFQTPALSLLRWRPPTRAGRNGSQLRAIYLWMKAMCQTLNDPSPTPFSRAPCPPSPVSLPLCLNLRRV